MGDSGACKYRVKPTVPFYHSVDGSLAGAVIQATGLPAARGKFWREEMKEDCRDFGRRLILGQFTVNKENTGVSIRAPLILLGLLFLGGCQSLLQEGSADVAGVGGAALATTVTNNAAVATGIGLGVRSGVRAGLEYALRKAQGAEQQSIANAAGPLRIGQVANWRSEQETHLIPDRAGEVTAVREIGVEPLKCREIIFSVVEGERAKQKRSFYTAAICREGQGWAWASAEPATARWGALQ